MTTTIKILIGIVIIVAIAVGAFLAAPLFYDVEVNESAPVMAVKPSPVVSNQPVPSATTHTVSGSFVGADSFHQASGTASIIPASDGTYIRFGEDFTVTNGPDLFVYLGKDGEYDPNANLGALKGNVGAQNYLIPENIDLSQYNEVHVWCRAFFQPFGHAALR